MKQQHFTLSSAYAAPLLLHNTFETTTEELWRDAICHMMTNFWTGVICSHFAEW